MQTFFYCTLLTVALISYIPPATPVANNQLYTDTIIRDQKAEPAPAILPGVTARNLPANRPERTGIFPILHGGLIEEKRPVQQDTISKKFPDRLNRDSVPQTVVCPICLKSDMVIGIIYGKPGKEAIKLSEAGKLKLGGCVISDKSPHQFCKRDKIAF
ncbi:MAG: hypothetical protein JWQ27_2211 [Ferruginibacter sp.]|nr:hypothetical protein [Ferruginibacter sp.]